MSRAASLIAKTNKILASVSPFDRQVYLRTTVASGGDALLGRYGSVTTTDTLLTPQPFVQRLGRDRIPGGHAMAETINVGSNIKIADDYMVLVSSTMVTTDQLQNPNVQLVFKDSVGAEETLVVHDFEQVSIDSTDIAFTIYCRSTKNQ